MNEHSAELAKQAAKGDQRAWGEITKTYGGLIHSLVWKYATGEEYLSEDVEQDAWTLMARRIGEYDPSVASLATWLTGLAMGAIHEGWRSRATDRQTEFVSLHNARNVSTDSEPPDEAAARDEQICELRRAIKHLPLRHRKVARLALIQERDGASIARLMGISRERVRQVLDESKKRISAEMAKDD